MTRPPQDHGPTAIPAQDASLGAGDASERGGRPEIPLTAPLSPRPARARLLGPGPTRPRSRVRPPTFSALQRCPARQSSHARHVPLFPSRSPAPPRFNGDPMCALSSLPPPPRASCPTVLQRVSSGPRPRVSCPSVLPRTPPRPLGSATSRAPLPSVRLATSGSLPGPFSSPTTVPRGGPPPPGPHSSRSITTSAHTRCQSPTLRLPVPR